MLTRTQWWRGFANLGALPFSLFEIQGLYARFTQNRCPILYWTKHAKFPLRARPKTTDRAIFWQIFGDWEYRKFDPPFAQSDPEFLDSIICFLARLKTIAPDIHIMIFRDPNFFFGPTFIGPTNDGVPISDYAQMQQALGLPTAPATDSQYGTDPGFRLYSRATSNGLVYLNWSGQSLTITLPNGATYLDRNGNQVTSLTIPDLSGNYVLLK